jgi:hypothetical protein
VEPLYRWAIGGLRALTPQSSCSCKGVVVSPVISSRVAWGSDSSRPGRTNRAAETRRSRKYVAHAEREGDPSALHPVQIGGVVLEQKPSAALTVMTGPDPRRAGTRGAGPR